MEIRSNIVADASGIISLVVDSDSKHEAATVFARGLEQNPFGTLIFVPSEILAETINLLGKKFGRGLAVETGRMLLNQAPFVVRESEPTTKLAALELYRTAPAGVSYTDCLVMAVADELHTHWIFGFDTAFAQRGYHLPGSTIEAA